MTPLHPSPRLGGNVFRVPLIANLNAYQILNRAKREIVCVSFLIPFHYINNFIKIYIGEIVLYCTTILYLLLQNNNQLKC